MERHWTHLVRQLDLRSRTMQQLPMIPSLLALDATRPRLGEAMLRMTHSTAKNAMFCSNREHTPAMHNIAQPHLAKVVGKGRHTPLRCH